MSLIPLVVTGDAVTVFDLELVKRLRRLGIVGVFSGTLPKTPQQNVFLGLPLQLSFYEALWLVEKGYGVLVDGPRYHEQIMLLGASQAQRVEILPGIEYAVVGNTYEEVDEEKLSSIVAQTVVHPADLKARLFGADNQRVDVYCAAFAVLREMDYYLMPGLRFGGDFVAYPGDPLQFHSHLIVRVLQEGESFDLLQLVTSGRLATAVKKVWVLIGEDKERDAEKDMYVPMKSFSIEWAGFG